MNFDFVYTIVVDRKKYENPPSTPYNIFIGYESPSVLAGRHPKSTYIGTEKEGIFITEGRNKGLFYRRTTITDDTGRFVIPITYMVESSEAYALLGKVLLRKLPEVFSYERMEDINATLRSTYGDEELEKRIKSIDNDIGIRLVRCADDNRR